MNIFISHSSKDKQIYEKLSKILREHGITTDDSVSINIGEKWIDKVKAKINQSDFLIAIITDNYLNSTWNNTELGYAILGSNIKVLPIIFDDVYLPSILMGHRNIKLESIESLETVIINEIHNWENLKEKQVAKPSPIVSKSNSNNNNNDNTSKMINLLHKALTNQQLSLVCGAGVSKALNIPVWNELIGNIITDIYFDKKTNKEDFVETLLSNFPSSNLILGKYLKLILKDDFEKELHKQIYNKLNQGDDAIKSDLIKSICSLARPNRLGHRLESIITFNYDDIIERSFADRQLEYQSIWEEGQQHNANAIPIYHVHGFLPQSGVNNSNIVFTEESYHSQFIDPYSWSNLIQLTTFASNVCLFIGISLNDPNLRRLLDISWRRNHYCNHYIAKKRNETENAEINETLNMLFEQDAISLGLNVIWYSNHNDLPSILSNIASCNRNTS